MNPKHQSVSHSVKPYNEDNIIIVDNLYMVLDGATGVGNKILDTPLSDAAWLTHRFAAHMTEDYDRRKPFKTLVMSVMDKVRSEYNSKLLTDDPKMHEIPSFGFIAVTLKDTHADFYFTGDCRAYCQTSTGHYVIGDSYLEHLDAMSAKEFKTFDPSLSLAERRKLLIPTLQKQRLKMNQPGGYDVANPLVFTEDHIRSSRAQGTTIENMILCSDGFYCYTELYNQCTPSQFNKLATEHGIAKLLMDIREIENNDPEALRYARFKVSDDSSAILLSF